jgi:carboxypeptidase T
MSFSRIFLIITVLLLCSPLYARETYMHVRIPIPHFAAWQKLSSLGLALEEGVEVHNREVEMIVNSLELKKLNQSGFSPIVVQSDMQSFFHNRSLAARSINDFAAGSMGGFYTFQETLNRLNSFRQKYKTLISSPIKIGKSIEGRPILAYRISDNADTNEANEPEVLYTALHHAREPESLMTVLYFMEKLLQGYGNIPEITYLINHRQMWFIPIVNPDGYVYNQQTNPEGGGLWRKNRRKNSDGSFGIDLNRNYGLFWGFNDFGSSPIPADETFRGLSAFSEPETEAIRHFVNAHQFLLALNYHSFRNLWIYPWAFTNKETDDKLIFREYAQYMTRQNKYQIGTTFDTLGYLANGEAADWFYGELRFGQPKIFAMTPEIGGFIDNFWPSQNRILPLARENYKANLALAWLAGGYIVVRNSNVVELSGNGNGIVEPSEQGTLHIELRNMGLKETIKNIAVSLSAKSPGIYIITNNVTYSDLKPFSNAARNFDFVLNNSTPQNTSLKFEITISSEGTILRKETLNINPGK